MSILEDPTEEEGGSTEDEERLTVKRCVHGCSYNGGHVCVCMYMCVYMCVHRLVYLLNVPDKLEAHSVKLLNWAKVGN